MTKKEHIVKSILLLLLCLVLTYFNAWVANVSDTQAWYYMTNSLLLFFSVMVTWSVSVVWIIYYSMEKS